MFLVCQNLYLYHQDGGAETGVLLQRDDEVWWVQVKDGQVSKIQVKYNYKYKTNTNFFLAIVVCTAAVAIDNICLCVNTNTHRQILSIATAAVQTTIMCKKLNVLQLSRKLCFNSGNAFEIFSTRHLSSLGISLNKNKLKQIRID